MREIKCRGWNEEDEEWIYGSYWNDSSVDDSFIIPFGREATGVNHNTIGQFTGLHDKNGVEIYENDKVFDGKYYGIIEYRECSFVINWEIDCSHDDDLNYWNDKIKVIGNIHERSGNNDK